MATDITQLPNRFFQPALSTQALGNASALYSDRLGNVVTDFDDINQCIYVILTTPKGADPHRPLFGSNLHLYIDMPINSARPYLVRETVDALRQWEPRIDIVKVKVSLDDVAQMAVRVEWKLTGEAQEIFVTNLALGVGR